MGLFDKKYCDVCGEKIGLLGNRKLQDGNLCKNCAKKLSHWFDDRRHSTVAEIEEQLAYRQENLEKVEAFNITRSLGRHTRVLLDEDKRQFMVARTNDIHEENPDVLDFAQVTGCDLDIDEDRSEEKRELEDGRMVSYNPPRYTWSYDFKMTIRVNHPYFDDMCFDLNNSSVYIEQEGRGGFGGRAFNPREHPDYLEFASMGQEIKEALTQIRSETRKGIDAANAPRKKMACSACGALDEPAANGCCQYCGSPL